MEHNEYPHIPGYLLGCALCESECFCDEDVETGRASECVYCEGLAHHYS